RAIVLRARHTSGYSVFVFSTTRPAPTSPLFPYTTLFRSNVTTRGAPARVTPDLRRPPAAPPPPARRAPGRSSSGWRRLGGWSAEIRRDPRRRPARGDVRSEERRVGKEGRCWGGACRREYKD